jgi:hypothetical protein
MGVDLFLNSVWEPWWADNMERVLNAPDIDPTSEAASITPAASQMYDEMRASGGYFRNGYNSGDVMWAMGLSWPHTVGDMLDSEGYLPVERARELLAMIEARPLTKERLTQHYLDHMTNGVEQHPVAGLLVWSLQEEMNITLQSPPPDFDRLAAFLRQRRTELIALLKNSIALDEPLLCSV